MKKKSISIYRSKLLHINGLKNEFIKSMKTILLFLNDNHLSNK